MCINVYNFRYRSRFGQDYFSFWCGGTLFLVINSQYYKDSSKTKIFSKEQDVWLMEQLNKNKGKRIVIFQHIPWFINKIDENNQYFNIEKNLRHEMLEKFHNSGK